MARRVFLAASLVMLLIVPAVAQQKKAAPVNSDPVVARINGQVLHRSQVELALHAAPPQIQKEPIEKIYPQLLNGMVNGLLLAQAARKAKVGEDPVVKEQIAMTTNEILADAYIARLARREITQAKLRELYDQYAKNAPKQEEVKARHILVRTEKEAKEIIKELDHGANFTTLAKEKSIDPSAKTNGGELGYFTENEMVPAFAKAAFALKKGQITQTPVHTQYGWHVIQVQDRRPGKAAPYKEVAPQIAQELTRQIVERTLKELHDHGKIELFDLDGKPLAMANQARPERRPAQVRPATPKLSLPSGLGGMPGVPGAPTLAPGTAPDQLNRH